MSDLEISKVRHGRVGEPQLRESTLQCCSPFHIGHDNLSTLSANQYYTSIFYQGCIGIDSKAWPPWHCCKVQGRWQGDGMMRLTMLLMCGGGVGGGEYTVIQRDCKL